jgi:glycosyltransferase involved in cell wall biosynthesis
LTILGDGPLKDLVKDTTHLHPNITYLAFQKKAMVIQYLKRCRALLFPSIWYEGFPLIIAEALSTATPVIASNVGGMGEIVVDRVNGLLFECGSEFDLSAKVSELLANPSFARNMAGMARSTYLSKYTPEKNYHQLVNIYEQAIRGHLVTA